ncbi:MAG: inositol monophosphatase [Deferribacterales bacterium]
MLNELIRIATKSGEMLKAGYLNRQDLFFKGKIDLVTNYDREIELYIIDEIKKIDNDALIVSEEYNCDKDTFQEAYIIDPIDGTTNFVHRFPFCAISIAFYAKNERFGVVYNPIMEEIFYAQTGKGAFLNGEKIYVDKELKVMNSLIATGFPYTVVERNSELIIRMLERVLKNSRGIRRAGSASLDLCYVAKSVFQGYYESGLKPWDVAAGIVIVEEAGGKISNLSGGKFSFNDDFIVATNGFIHEELLGILNGC